MAVPRDYAVLNVIVFLPSSSSPLLLLFFFFFFCATR